MSSVTVAVHGKVVHKRQYRYGASSAGGRALANVAQLATGRKVKASNFVYYDVVRGIFILAETSLSEGSQELRFLGPSTQSHVRHASAVSR